jgi:hypothetical protein
MKSSANVLYVNILNIRLVLVPSQLLLILQFRHLRFYYISHDLFHICQQLLC